MTPLAGDGVASRQDLAADHEAGPASRANDESEDDVRVGSGTVDGFRYGETIGVVSDANGATQGRGEVLIERLADEAC